MRRQHTAVLGVLGVWIGVGCASILGIKDGMPYPDGGGDGMAGDGMGVDVEVPPDVNVEANSAVCDDFPRQLLDGGVFLSANGVDNGECTASKPCRTLQVGIGAAQQRSAPIYLGPGDYGGGLTIPAGDSVIVEGGWWIDGGSWQPVCDFNVARIRGAIPVANGGAAVKVDQGATLVLRLVSIENDPVDGSAYGVFGSGAKITLEAVGVRSGAPSPGKDGKAGGGTGNPECTLGMGEDGGNGATGAAGGFAYGIGYTPTSGGTGSPGDAGGSTAPPPPPTASCTSCTVMMSMCNASVALTPGDPGGRGCGGGGGIGGAGGFGGGASIAVYATGAGTIIIKSGTLLAAANGATGGNGAPGAPGATGTAGSMGNANAVTAHSCMASACVPLGTCNVPPGAGGPPGGVGGAGGRGGGGQGGASIALVHEKSTTLDVRDASIFSWTVGGAGGAPNGPTGESGKLRSFP